MRVLDIYQPGSYSKEIPTEALHYLAVSFWSVLSM